LRARVGHSYIFFDGEVPQDFVYEISEIDAKRVVFILQEVLQKNSEVFPNLHLYQAIPNKFEKLEYIIQKSCEV
jgi:16S rRNA U1498 N3-methylase RsmE